MCRRQPWSGRHEWQMKGVIGEWWPWELSKRKVIPPAGFSRGQIDGQADSYILPRLRLSGVWLTVYSGDIICKTNMFHLFHKFFSWFLIELTFDFYLLESIEVFLYFFYGSIFSMLWQLELEVQVSCRGHIWAVVIFDIKFSTWFQTGWHLYIVKCHWCSEM